MSLFEKIEEDLIKALKAGEKEKLTVLRSLKSDIKYRQIDIGEEFTEDDLISVITSSAKKRRDSIEQFKKGGREDLVKNEEFGLNILNQYLPEQISEEKLLEIINKAIEDTGADSPQKIGLIMKAVMPQVKDRADGKLINRLATKLLSK